MRTSTTMFINPGSHLQLQRLHLHLYLQLERIRLQRSQNKNKQQSTAREVARTSAGSQGSRIEDNQRATHRLGLCKCQ